MIIIEVTIYKNINFTHLIAFLFLISMLSVSCSHHGTKTFPIHIIPTPKQMVMEKGHFKISTDTKLVAKSNTQQVIANYFNEQLEKASGMKLTIVTETPESNFIGLIECDTLGQEAYKLEITNNKIELSASENAGFVYGLETIYQLMPQTIYGNRSEQTVWSLPAVMILDEPRFGYRGVMLDLSRHFFDKNYIKKTIDRLAMHKMNVLHLHLVDDQGWRMEIKQYPKLTDIAAWRVDQEDLAWNARKKNAPSEKGTYGGFLTQNDLKEIVVYAASKNVEVIPEIEMPAHVSCAIAAYPELSCTETPIGVPSGGVWPITDIYCAGKESTFTFLENILDEVVEIFPSPYIHIGGDEATKTNWNMCPHCQRRIQNEGLESVEELQSYFVQRIEKYINRKGKKLIGWDEILEGGLAPEATVMSWRGTKGGLEAAKQGHDVIMTPESHCYYNFYQGPQDEEPQAFNAYLPMSKAYTFDPIVPEMGTEEAKHVLGGQANLWSEYITSPKESEYMLYPRLAAMSESLWSPKDSKNWEDFSTRLKSQFIRYQHAGINYAKSVYLVTSVGKANLEHKTINITLQNELPGSDIRYTLNDENLIENGQSFVDSINVDTTTVLRAQMYSDGKPTGKLYIDTIQFHDAFAKKIAFSTPPHSSYEGDDPQTLVNVLRGSKNFHDGQWQGWLGDDMEVIIDLEQTQEIHEVIVGTLENQGAGIYFPTEIKVFASEDGDIYTKVGQAERAYSASGDAKLLDLSVDIDNIKTRFIKVIVSNLGKGPNGGGSWLFIDEVVVR